MYVPYISGTLYQNIPGTYVSTLLTTDDTRSDHFRGENQARCWGVYQGTLPLCSMYIVCAVCSTQHEHPHDTGRKKRRVYMEQEKRREAANLMLTSDEFLSTLHFKDSILSSGNKCAWRYVCMYIVCGCYGVRTE